MVADLLEGPPDVVMLIRATERQELAKLAIDALLSVESLTEDVKCLPVIEEGIANTRIGEHVVGGELWEGY